MSRAFGETWKTEYECAVPADLPRKSKPSPSPPLVCGPTRLSENTVVRDISGDLRWSRHESLISRVVLLLDNRPAQNSEEFGRSCETNRVLPSC
jgi:hypothetical protein